MWGVSTQPPYGTSMPGAGPVHHIICYMGKPAASPAKSAMPRKRPTPVSGARVARATNRHLLDLAANDEARHRPPIRAANKRRFQLVGHTIGREPPTQSDAGRTTSLPLACQS